jgi:isoleucyl-tRNA synthetase
MAEVCLTSGIEVIAGKLPADAVVASDVKCVGVIPKRAEGKKCARSWRITKDVGSDPAYPDLSARDAAAMREIDGVVA